MMTRTPAPRAVRREYCDRPDHLWQVAELDAKKLDDSACVIDCINPLIYPHVLEFARLLKNNADVYTYCSDSRLALLREAHSIYTDNSPQSHKLKLEAYLCTPSNNEVIAHRLGLPVAVVRTYEVVFFNLENFRASDSLFNTYVLAWSDDKPADLGAKVVAYFFGLEKYEAMFHKTALSSKSSDMRDELAKMLYKHNVQENIAGINGPLNRAESVVLSMKERIVTATETRTAQVKDNSIGGNFIGGDSQAWDVFSSGIGQIQAKHNEVTAGENAAKLSDSIKQTHITKAFKGIDLFKARQQTIAEDVPDD